MPLIQMNPDVWLEGNDIETIERRGPDYLQPCTLVTMKNGHKIELLMSLEDVQGKLTAVYGPVKVHR
jgi:uncharacterized protein YlzI (FlbEa/FlbD family)